MVETVLHPVDVKRIQMISLATFSRLDSLIWHYDSHGRYVVKSGFRVALSLKYVNQDILSSSSNNGEKCLWKAIWSISIPLKL